MATRKGSPLDHGWVTTQVGNPLEAPADRVHNWASNVLRWLNGQARSEYDGANTPQSRGRVLWLIEAIRSVQDMVRKAPDVTVLLRSSRKLERLCNQIDACLWKYPTALSFQLTRDGECIFDDGSLSGRFPAGEGVAIYGVVALARMHMLDRLRRCECGQWLFARFTHQRFHSERCRKRSFERSDKFRQKRSEYMRWYYQMYQSPRTPKKKLTFEQWKRANRAKRGA